MSKEFQELKKALDSQIAEYVQENADLLGEVEPESTKANLMGTEEILKPKQDLSQLSNYPETAALAKSAPVPVETRKVLRRASLVDPNFLTAYGGSAYGAYREKLTLVPNQVLKSVTLKDPILAAIIQARIYELIPFAKPQSTRYDTGFLFKPKNKDQSKDEQTKKEIEFLNNYIINTGITKYRDPDDMLDFRSFLSIAVRNYITFGLVPVETVRDRYGRIHSFYCADGGSIYFANENLADNYVDSMKDLSYRNSGPTSPNLAEYFKMRKEKFQFGAYKYVQVVDGKIVAAFSRDEMVFKIANPQGFIETNGYPMSTVEMALITLTTHLQAEGYNSKFFSHGFASRGMLHIKGDITRTQLDAFRGAWYAQISGNSNSWRTPIIAGVEDVQWIPLSPNNRDMEYMSLIDHLARTLCAIMNISPMEIGFDHLSKGPSSRTLSESSNEWKVQESKERGLRPILGFIEDLINNDILPGIDPELCKKYTFEFVGLDAEDKAEELQRQTLELQVHSSLDEIRKEIEKKPVLGGAIPLNPQYVEILFKTHTVGEIREKLLGYAGDSQKPEYRYIPDGVFIQNLQLMHQIKLDTEQAQMQEAQLAQQAASQSPGVPGQLPPGSPEQLPPEASLPGGEAPPMEASPPGKVEEVVEEFVAEHPELENKSETPPKKKKKEKKDVTETKA